jgi:NADPH:quinone reductase
VEEARGDAGLKAVQVSELDGPDAAVVADVEEPRLDGAMTVEVKAAGIAFPDLLMTRGLYQYKPEPPFVLGSEGAGVVASAPDGSGFSEGDRVAFMTLGGCFAERVAVMPQMAFKLIDELSFEQGAAFILNYHTAHFGLLKRGQLQEGETVLVHGASGGVGTATLQVARGLGVRTIAVVSTDEKAAFAQEAGADETVLLDGFKDSVATLTGGRGVDAVVDVVGGDAFTDSLRCLGEQGRLLVVGFASGQGIPEVKVNRLLLHNVDVRGVGWGAFAMTKPTYMRDQWDLLLPMLESGTVRPPIGATYDLDGFGQALQDMADRRTLGKSVVRLRPT